MAEYCTKCLIEILKMTPKQAKKINRVYKKDEKDLCEGCGKITIMRNLDNENTRRRYKTLNEKF